MRKEVRAIITDAEDLLRKAVEEMDINIRHAAEKAWGPP